MGVINFLHGWAGRDNSTPVRVWIVEDPADLAAISESKEGDIGYSTDGAIYRRTVGLVGWALTFDPSVGGGGAAWGSITGVLASQTDLALALVGKSATGHTHIEGDITGLTADLAGKAALVHTHAEADVTGLVADLAGKQPLDADLTTIAGLTATTDNFLVSVASAWASRTPAQAKVTLALDSVDNVSDANKPVSTATQTALNLKADLASPTFSGTPSLPTGTTATTQAAADNTTKLATTAFATTADNLKANLASPTFTGTVTMPGPTINDATDITISATTGTKIGQAGSKIGFYGVAPAVRPTTLTQTYSTASSTHAAVTQLAAPAGGTGTAAGGYDTAANRNLAITSINAARTDIANLKNFVNQIVDQLQAIGLLQ